MCVTVCTMTFVVPIVYKIIFLSKKNSVAGVPCRRFLFAETKTQRTKTARTSVTALEMDQKPVGNKNQVKRKLRAPT